jgi:type IV secretion system protein VirD4
MVDGVVKKVIVKSTRYIPYKIKVLNLDEFSQSMHYNPFSYFREEKIFEDVTKFVDVFILNTNADGKATGGDMQFWENCEKMVYIYMIMLIFTIFPPAERNIRTLLSMITNIQVRENDENFQSGTDKLFECIEHWINGCMSEEDKEFSDNIEYFNREYLPTEQQKLSGNYAVNYYKRYKLAAGKTAKSILVSCLSRLSKFDGDIGELTSYDELEIDKIGDRLTALFVIIPDMNTTYNFLAAILYSQMFDLLSDSRPAIAAVKRRCDGIAVERRH